MSLGYPCIGNFESSLPAEAAIAKALSPNCVGDARGSIPKADHQGPGSTRNGHFLACRLGPRRESGICLHYWQKA